MTAVVIPVRVRRFRGGPPIGLSVAGIVVAAFFALPLAYLLWHNIGVGRDLGDWSVELREGENAGGQRRVRRGPAVVEEDPLAIDVAGVLRMIHVYFMEQKLSDMFADMYGRAGTAPMRWEMMARESRE